jgi:hypothetical protein
MVCTNIFHPETNQLTFSYIAHSANRKNMRIIISKTGVPIRFPEERWFHITEEHSEMAGYYFDVLETVEEPEAIYEGKMGEFLAVRVIEEGKYIVVVYKELSKEDGFVITAFLTRQRKQLEKRRNIWKR